MYGLSTVNIEFETKEEFLESLQTNYSISISVCEFSELFGLELESYETLCEQIEVLTRICHEISDEYGVISSFNGVAGIVNFMCAKQGH